MMFNLLVFVMIILITLYLATQGMLSALLALATATFSSILAMALMEPLQGLVGSWRPEYGRGVTLLVLFLIIFSATRILADMAVPDNIKLSLLVNRIAGGAIGFITALVVAGTILLGLQMLPLPRSLMGFDRFPGDNAMQGEGPGELSRNTNGVWFSPDQFVQLIWKGASGRSLGGTGLYDKYSWADVHPDLTVESYGYRNNVWKASQRTLPADLFSVSAAWYSSDPKDYETLGIPATASRGRAVLVRSEVKRGDRPPDVSTDPEDAFFRITPTQVRLLTSKQRQYYPIGYLDQGRKFQPLPLDSGHLVEDYASGGGGSRVVEDWVFMINDDEVPTVFEMKEYARADLAGILKPNRPSPMVASAYPPKAYLKDLSSITVTFNAGGKKIEAAKVYLVAHDMLQDDVISEVRTAFDRLESINASIRDGTNGWSRDPKPGVPEASFINYALRDATNMKTDPGDKSEPWQYILNILLAGQAEPDGERNLSNYPAFFEDHFIPMLQNAKKASALRGTATADADGKAELPRNLAGMYGLIATMKTDRGFFVWYVEPELTKGRAKPTPFPPTAGRSQPFPSKSTLTPLINKSVRNSARTALTGP